MESKCPLQFVPYDGDDTVSMQLVANYNEKIHELYAVFSTTPPMVNSNKITKEIIRHERELGMVLSFANKNKQKDWVTMNADVIDENFRFFQKLRKDNGMSDEIDFMLVNAQPMGKTQVVSELESSFVKIPTQIKLSKLFERLVRTYKRLASSLKRFYQNSLKFADQNKAEIVELQKENDLTDLEREMLGDCLDHYSELEKTALSYEKQQKEVNSHFAEEYIQEQLEEIDGIEGDTELEREMLKDAGGFYMDIGH